MALNANKTKAQKKNEKRKEKKATETASRGSGVAQHAGTVAARLEDLSIANEQPASGSDDGAAAAPALQPSSSTTAPATDIAAVEKQIRALKKKAMLCEMLCFQCQGLEWLIEALTPNASSMCRSGRACLLIQSSSACTDQQISCAAAAAVRHLAAGS